MVEVGPVGGPVFLVAGEQLPADRGPPTLGGIGDAGEGQSPAGLAVAALQRHHLGALAAVEAIAREQALDRLVRTAEPSDVARAAVEAFADVGQREIGVDVVHGAVAHRQPARFGAGVVFQLPLGAGDQAQPLALEAQAAQFVGEQPQPAQGAGLAGARDLLGKVERHDDDVGGIGLAQARQHAEHRAVGVAGRHQRGTDGLAQIGQRRCRRVQRVGEIAVGEQVERRRLGAWPALDQDRALAPQAVADAQLVEHVGVVQRDVADHQVGLDDQREHVLADVAGVDDLAGGAAVEAVGGQRRREQFVVDALEVDATILAVALLAERSDDECPGHRLPRAPTGHGVSRPVRTSHRTCRG